MKEYLTLLKWQLKNMYGLDKKTEYAEKPLSNSHTKMGDIVAKIRSSSLFSSILVGICFLPIVVFLCIALVFATPEIFSIGLQSQFINTIIGSTQCVIFFFGIMSIMGNLYFSKDNEFLASLPIKSSTVFMSKFTIVYLSELLVAAFVLIPSLLTIGITAQVSGFGVNWFYYIMMPFVVILAPIAPLFIVSVLSLPIMYVVSFFKKRAAFSGIVGIVVFVGVMACYFGFSMNMKGGNTDDVILLLSTMLNTTSNIFIFNIFMVKAMLLSDIAVNLLINLAILIGFFVVSYLLSSTLYKKAQVIQLESNVSKKRKSKEEKTVSGKISPEMAIVKRDLKMIIREPALAFNSFMGPLLTPVLLLLVAKPMFGTMTGNSTLIGIAMLFMYPLMLLCGTNYFATIAFSREGDKFYINKYLPIDLKTLAKGKLWLANGVSFVGIAITCVAAILVSKMSFVIAIFYTGTLVIYSIAFNYMGLYRDMKSPILAWTHIQQITKKNVGAVIPLFIGMAIGMGTVLLAGALTVSKAPIAWSWVIIWSVLDILGIVLLVLAKTKFDKNIYKFLSRIEC